MIQIYVPGKGNIQLADDTSISLKLNNPIFADDNFIPGDYSFPFNLPGGDASPDNAWILEHPDIPDNHKNRFELQDVELSLENNIFRKGTLLIDKANNTRYSANFRWGMKNISDDFKNYKIRDLVDEQITITTETYYKKVVVSWGGGSLAEYSIVVNGTTFTNTTLALLATDINNDEDLTASFVSAGSTYGVSGDRIEIEPTADPTNPETEFTVNFETGYTPTGYSITSNPFTDFYADYEAFLDSYYDVSPPKDYIRFPIIWNLTNENGYSNPIFINYPTASSYYFGTKTFKGASFSPFTYLSHIFQKIQEQFGINFDGDFFDDAEYPNALFYHNHPFFTDKQYIESSEYRFYDNVINLRYTVPDITVETLLKALQKKYNLSIVYKEDINTIRINFRKPVMLSKKYVEWTGKSSNAKDIVYEETTNGYELQSAVDENDELDTDDNYTYVDGSKIIPCELGSIKQDEGSSFTNSFFGPSVKQKIDGKFIPRLIFYKGTDTASDGLGGTITYQRASHKGMEVTFDGTGALGESEWLEYLRFITNRKIVQFDINLEFRDLNEIDWEKKVRIFGDDYLIKSISTRISTKSIETSKVELYKI
jgi:hypothetical protein